MTMVEVVAAVVVAVVLVVVWSATYQCYWCPTARVFVVPLLWDFRELLTFGFDFASHHHQQSAHA